MALAFYTQLDETRFASGDLTRGPWAPDTQHAGPPCALLTRTIEQTAPREDMFVARVTNEILGPVPVAELDVRATLVRPGRSVEMLEAEMRAGDRVVMRTRAWRVRRTDTASVASPDPLPDPVPPPGPNNKEREPTAYFAAVELRFTKGGFSKPGPATAWTRLLCQVVDGEEPSGLSRVMVVADSGNGMSQVLDFQTWYYINPELTVHLHREPVGEWICLDAATTISNGGVGLATTSIFDEHGPIGRGAQALYVAPR